MKFTLLAACILCALTLAVPAQVTARNLTRKVVPQTPPAQTAPRAAAPGAAAVQQPAVDPAKVQAGKEEVERKRLEYQKKRAEEGSPIAQFDMGLRYMKGDGVEKNLELAEKWFTLAEKNGNVHATKQLAELKKLK